MKAYQVFKGDVDKHNHQYYELKATFLSEQKAVELALGIVASTPLFGDILEENKWKEGTVWTAVGWERVDICKINEIEIVEQAY